MYIMFGGEEFTSKSLTLEAHNEVHFPHPFVFFFCFLEDDNSTGRIKQFPANREDISISLPVEGLNSLNGLKVLHFKNQTSCRGRKMSSLA